MVADHDLGVPAGGDKDGLDTTGKRRGEDVGDLETDEERKSDDDGGEAASLVEGGFGDNEVDVGDQGACVADEHGAKGQDGANQAVLRAC